MSTKLTPYEKNPDPPNAVQVEPTEGCNLRCTFCGLQGIREAGSKDYRYMDLATAEVVARKLAEAGWNPRIEFAMHGEPTLHPNLAGLVSVFRQHLPRASLMLTTNGGGLVAKPGPVARLAQLFAAGLNIIALDAYEAVNLGAKVRAAVQRAAADGQWPEGVPVYEYPAEPAGNPHRRARPNERRMVFIRDISLPDVVTGTHAKLSNHCGAAFPLNEDAQGKRCHRPFREMSVRWDGSVAVCCNDWRGVLPAGNLVRDSLHEVWAGPVMRAARRKLYHGERTFGPCKGCDATSYRVGLLPDKLGKQELPRATRANELVLAEAVGQGPLTLPVLRPWEQGQPLP